MSPNFLQKTIFTVAVTFLLSLSALSQNPAPPRGYADALLGRWDLTVSDPAGSYPSWLEISHRTETSLMGRFVGRFGSLRHLARIEFSNGQLSFQLPPQYEAPGRDLVFRGTLAGDKLEGTFETSDGKTLNWTGVRASEMTRTGLPKWGKPISLFNGKDLTGWRLRGNSRGNCWSVENGSLVNNSLPCVDILTEQKFTDFRLQVEFNIVPGSNSGIYLRGRHEVQIQDDIDRVRDSLRMGGLYGFLRPSVMAAKKPGEWQTYDITLVGRRVTVILNGQTIINHEEIPGITGGAIDGDEAAPGPILLQGDHGKIYFRKIVITPAR
jgi:hypothetical protein